MAKKQVKKCSISLGNANQNYSEVSPNTDQNGIVKESVGSKCREGVEKTDPSYTVTGNVN